MERPSLTDQEVKKLLDYLMKRARIMACLIPGDFDSCSAEDLVQDVIVHFLQGKVVFDGARGASLETFLATVMHNRLIDLGRRRSRFVPWNALRLKHQKHAALPPSQTMSKHRLKLETLEQCAREDPEARSLLTAVRGYKMIPHNMDQAFAEDLGQTVEWVQKVKNRIKYAAQQRRLRSEAARSVPHRSQIGVL